MVVVVVAVVWHMLFRLNYVENICTPYIMSRFFFCCFCFDSIPNLWRRIHRDFFFFWFTLFAWLQTMIGFMATDAILTTKTNLLRFFFLWKWISFKRIFWQSLMHTRGRGKENYQNKDSRKRKMNTFWPPSYQMRAPFIFPPTP